MLPPRALSRGLEAGGGSSSPSAALLWGFTHAAPVGAHPPLAAETCGRTIPRAATTHGHRKVALVPGPWSQGALGPL